MGFETETIVELLDIYPTLVDFCHLKSPHKLQGKSLRPIAEDPSTNWRKPAYTQVSRAEVGMGYSVRHGDWRLTQWGQNGFGGLELYNVIKDKEGYFNYANDPKHATLLDRLYSSLRKGYRQISRNSR
jgi:arylsulfatase A-like enzyme